MFNSNRRTWSLRGNRWILPVLLVLALGALAVAKSLSKLHLDQLMEARRSELSAVAHQTAAAVALWKQEQTAQAEALSADPRLLESTEGFLADSDSPLTRDPLARLMSAIRANHGYRAVIILDAQARVRLSAPQTVAGLPYDAGALVAGAVQSHKPAFSVFHRCVGSGCRGDWIDLAVPLPLREGGDSEPAVLVLRIDVDATLLPLLRDGGAQDGTEQVLLIERAGNDLIYVNAPRPAVPGSSLVRAPVAENPVVVAAQQDQEWLVSTPDYRGIRVAAAVREVPDSPWIVIAQMDMKEAAGLLSGRWLLIGVLILLFMHASAGAVFLLWRLSTTQIEQRRLATEQESRRLSQRFDRLTRYANDIILVYDSSLRIVDVNDRALEGYGYTREELLKLPVIELRAESARLQYAEDKRHLDAESKIVFETTHRRQDGSTFPVEVSARVQRDGDETLYVNVIRDVTARVRTLALLAASEARYRRIVETAEEGVWVVDLNRNTTFVNSRLAQMLGYQREELLGLPESALLCPAQPTADDPGATDELDVQHEQEFRLVRKDGSGLWVLRSSSDLVDENGAVVGVLSMLTDITQHRTAQQRVIRLNRLYAVLTDTNQAIARIRDQAGLLRSVCRIACDSGRFDMAWVGAPDPGTGRVREVAHAGRWPDSLPAGHYAAREASTDDDGPTAHALRAGECQIRNDIPGAPQAKAGAGESARPQRYSVGALPLRSEGQIVFVLTLQSTEADFFDPVVSSLFAQLGVDVSYALDSIAQEARRQRTVAALKDSEEKYRLVVENAADSICCLDEDGRFLVMNGAMARILSGEAETWIGKTLHDAFPKEYADRQLDFIRQVLETGRGVARAALAPFQGRMRRLNVSIQPVVNSADSTRYAQLIIRDETDFREAKEVLWQTRALLEHSPAVLFKLDADDKLAVEFVSQNVSQFGYQAVDFTNGDLRYADLVHRDDLAQLLDEIRDHTETNRLDLQVEHRIVTKDGEIRWVDNRITIVPDSGAERGYLQGVMLDITRRKQLEEQFLQSQKMESVGRLAGGIAHDFNNLLTAIGVYSSLILESTPAGSPVREDIGQVIRATERASSLTRQLLAFSRRQVLEPRIVDLTQLVLDVHKMLRRLISDNIDLSVEPSPQGGLIKADPGQVEQVIVNLVVNARDAMPNGGSLRISIRNESIDEAEARRYPDTQPGDYVALNIEDTGTGMAKEVKEHLFEPFYTTKGPGKGTGLGLATVYGIVKQHRGHIWVESQVGRGTTFRVFWPRVSQDDEASARKEAAPTAPHGTETVLIVDDEPVIRALAHRTLSALGYTLLSASDGQEALTVATAHLGPIDLLLTDVVMPRLGGKALSDRLAAIRPGLRTLYISGQPDDSVIGANLFEGSITLLHKPFSVLALAQKVREVLDK